MLPNRLTQCCSVLLLGSLLFACEEEKKEAPPPKPSAAAVATAAPVPSEPPPAPKNRDDCPKGSTPAPGTSDKPCLGSGDSRMMEVTWTGKTEDQGPKF